jgi:hypothetical protein
VTRQRSLMDRATAVDHRAPSYYGSACLALAQQEIKRGAGR